MSVDLYYLALSAVLCLVLWVPYVMARFGIWGIVETVGYPENPPPLPGWAGRAERAHRNMVENLVPFTALVLVASLGGFDNHLTAMGSAIFFWSRLAHAVVYMLGGSPVDINLSIGTDAAGTRVYDDFEIPADSVKTNFDPYELAAGEKIQGWASFSPRLVDDFNRANAANLGTCSVVGSWSGSVNGSTEGWQIISNQAAPDTGSGMSSVHSETYGPDVQLGVTLATKQADGQYCGLFGRVTDANTVNFDGYYIEYTAIAGAANDIFSVYRTVNGSGTQLTTPASSITYELSSGNKWGCAIRGTGATVTNEIFVDTGSGWTSIGTFTDTHADRRVTAGRTAIYGDSSTLRFDDYGIGPSTVLTITGYEDPV